MEFATTHKVNAFHIKPSFKKMVFQLGLKHISHSHTLSIKAIKIKHGKNDNMLYVILLPQGRIMFKEKLFRTFHGFRF